MTKRISLLIVLLVLVLIMVFLPIRIPWMVLSPIKVMLSTFPFSDLPSGWYYSTVIVLTVLLMIVIWFVIQIVPKRQAQALQTPQKKLVVDEQGIDEEGSMFIPQSSIKPTELFSIENEARKTLSQIIGGFIVIVSLILTGANLAVTQREAEKNRSLALEGQITDRFTKAITQLDRKNGMEVRLGGIYALERIAKDSEKDHWTIMEVLTAYIRENAPVKKLESSLETSSKKAPIKAYTPPRAMLPTDIQAILTVLGRRNASGEKNRLDLSNTSLIEAMLIGANLSGINLEGATLSRAYLKGATLSWADLSRANLEGATLRVANLKGAYLRMANLTGADLSGVRTLTWEQLSEAIIDDRTKLPPEIETQHKDELKAMREKTRKKKEGK